MNPLTADPKQGQLVLVKCTEYCQEGYCVATFEDDSYMNHNNDITEYVEGWISFEMIEKFFD